MSGSGGEPLSRDEPDAITDGFIGRCLMAQTREIVSVAFDLKPFDASVQDDEVSTCGEAETEFLDDPRLRGIRMKTRDTAAKSRTNILIKHSWMVCRLAGLADYPGTPAESKNGRHSACECWRIRILPFERLELFPLKARPLVMFQAELGGGHRSMAPSSLSTGAQENDVINRCRRREIGTDYTQAHRVILNLRVETLWVRGGRRNLRFNDPSRRTLPTRATNGDQLSATSSVSGARAEPELDYLVPKVSILCLRHSCIERLEECRLIEELDELNIF